MWYQDFAPVGVVVKKMSPPPLTMGLSKASVTPVFDRWTVEGLAFDSPMILYDFLV
jgi:hypothetical protein